MQQNMYKVYLIRENSTGNIKYVGLTRNTLMQRMYEHSTSKKFKLSDFSIELIEENLTIENAALLEREKIKQYDLLKTGWNKSPGSINGFSNNHSEEQKLKWSDERKGKPVSEEHAVKNKTARLGKRNSEYHNKRISECSRKQVMCIDTGMIFESCRKAADYYGASYPRVSDVCTGKRKTTKGLRFKHIIK